MNTYMYMNWKKKSGAVVCNVAFTVDRTWQKRGHSSKTGVALVLAVETWEILDYEIRSLYCHACVANKSKKQSSEEYRTWKSEHVPYCCLDRKGSSDSMETDCAADIFLRSVERYGLHYKHFLVKVTVVALGLCKRNALRG